MMYVLQRRVHVTFMGKMPELEMDSCLRGWAGRLRLSVASFLALY